MFSYSFSAAPLPLFSLAALVHALHVRPSCYYKLLGGLTSLIANTDNGTILTQRPMSTGKTKNMRGFLCLHYKFTFPTRCFDLFKYNLLINTFLNKKIPNGVRLMNSRCPFFDRLFSDAMALMCTCVYLHDCVCVSKREHVHGMFVKVFMAHMCVCSKQ